MPTTTQTRAECQICGRVQALDSDGTIHIHGYQVPGWGRFEGLCQGSHSQPYPSKDALVRWVAQLADGLPARIQRLAEDAKEARGLEQDLGSIRREIKRCTARIEASHTLTATEVQVEVEKRERKIVTDREAKLVARQAKRGNEVQIRALRMRDEALSSEQYAAECIELDLQLIANPEAEMAKRRAGSLGFIILQLNKSVEEHVAAAKERMAKLGKTRPLAEIKVDRKAIREQIKALKIKAPCAS